MMQIGIGRLAWLSAAMLAMGASGALAQDEGAAEEPAAAPVKPMPAEIMPLASKSLLLDLFNTGERLIAVGDRGNIVASVNGIDWAQVNVPVRAPLTAVHFADAAQGWAVGHDAAIVHTGDGGKTWALQNFEPELEKPFLDVLFLDPVRGFAVGAYGLFYQTSDGGENWTEVSSPIREEELHFNAIVRLNNGDLFIAGEQATLAISSDAGATWQKLESPYESSMFGALPLGEKGVVIFGLRGNMFLSPDPRAGSWTKIDAQTVASMFGGTVLDNGDLAMVGLNGNIVIAGANGGDVRLLKTPSGTPLSAVVPFGDGLLAVGESGAQRIALK